MVRMNRQRRSRTEMESLLARKVDEGLTYQQLADESGIPMSTIAAWGRKLKPKPKQESFVELQLKDSNQHASIWIETRGGLRIGIGPGFDDSTLARILRALPC